MKPSVMVFVLFCCTVMFSACNKNETAEKAKEAEDTIETLNNDANQNMEDGINQAIDQIGDLQDDDVKVMSYTEIKGLLPETFMDIPLSGDKKGNASSMGSFNIAVGEANYRKDDMRVNLEVTDTGKIPMLVNSMGTFAKMKINQEGDDGYNRSITVAGNPGIMEFNKNSKQTKVNLLVDERFIVAVKAYNLDDQKVLNEVKKMVKKM